MQLNTDDLIELAEADYNFYDLVKRPCDTSELVDDVGVVGNIHENPQLLEATND